VVATEMKTRCCCYRCSCPSVVERQNASRTNELLFPKMGTISGKSRRERGQCFPVQAGRNCWRRGHRGQTGEQKRGKRESLCGEDWGGRQAFCLSSFCLWGLAPLALGRSGRDAFGRKRGSERTDGWDAAAAGSLSDWSDWPAAAALRSTSTPTLRSAIPASSPSSWRREASGRGRDTTISDARKRVCGAPTAPQSSNAHTEVEELPLYSQPGPLPRRPGRS